MMQVIKKWRILITFDVGDKQITFTIHDNMYSNMLRKLNEISFDFEPSRIVIDEIRPDNSLHGQLVGVTQEQLNKHLKQ